MDVELKATGTPAQVEQKINQQIKALRDQNQRDGHGDTWPLLSGVRDYVQRRLAALPKEKIVRRADGTRTTVAVEHDVTVPLKLSFGFEAKEVERPGEADEAAALPAPVTPVASASPSGRFIDRRGSTPEAIGGEKQTP